MSRSWVIKVFSSSSLERFTMSLLMTRRRICPKSTSFQTQRKPIPKARPKVMQRDHLRWRSYKSQPTWIKIFWERGRQKNKQKGSTSWNSLLSCFLCRKKQQKDSLHWKSELSCLSTISRWRWLRSRTGTGYQSWKANWTKNTFLRVSNSTATLREL